MHFKTLAIISAFALLFGITAANADDPNLDQKITSGNLSENGDNLSQNISVNNAATHASAVEVAQPIVKMPKIYYESLKLISDPERRATVQVESEQYFENGRRDKAASVIGRAIGSEHDFSLSYLGKFCLATLPTAGVTDAQGEFLTGLMRGYSRSGILMFTTSGLKNFYAYSMKRGAPWPVVSIKSNESHSDKCIYLGKGVAFIPFPYGKKLKLDITANGRSDVKMWKILPEGANVKNWTAGKWEREITIRGDVKY